MVNRFCTEGHVSRQPIAASWISRRREPMDRGAFGSPPTSFGSGGGGADRGGFPGCLHLRFEHGVAGLFVACGAVEFSALNLVGYRAVVRAAVEEVGNAVLVVAGVGYSLGLARDFAAVPKKEGARRLLLLPHGFLEAPQDTLIASVERILEDIGLRTLVYQRGVARLVDQSVLRIQLVLELIGLKDGNSEFVGLRIVALFVYQDFLFFIGFLTGYINLRAYASIGITPYSSSAASCTPEIACTFFRKTREADNSVLNRLLSEFLSPLVALRDSLPGYAVSLIKVTAFMRVQRVGPVRTPLLDPQGEDLAELEPIVRHGLATVGAGI